MTARPILFSGPMVRALLEGRKTQTRRTIKASTARGSFVLSFNHGIPEFNFGPDDLKPNGDLRWHRCPHGQPGDLLWVREAHAMDDDGHREWPLFRADDASLPILPLSRKPARWKPGIHMPRWASRLTLRITDVRVQRLQEISESDAGEEGIKQCEGGAFDYALHLWAPGMSPRGSFLTLWQSINGADSWDANPWVWALTFDVIKQNIGTIEP